MTAAAHSRGQNCKPRTGTQARKVLVRASVCSTHEIVGWVFGTESAHFDGRTTVSASMTRRSRARSAPRVLLVASVVSLASLPVLGATSTDQRTPDLASASLEELMNMPITSASRKEQRAIDVAAAVYVITRDDIRESGLLTVPE